MKYITISFALLALLFVSGCASIVNGTSQPISVTTPPTKGATCSLKNDKGTWYVNSTPGSVVVHRSFNNLVVTCHKKGYRKARKRVKSHTKGMAFGNIVFGGVVGAGVDVVDGAAYRYPSTIIVGMKKRRK